MASGCFISNILFRTNITHWLSMFTSFKKTKPGSSNRYVLKWTGFAYDLFCIFSIVSANEKHIHINKIHLFICWNVSKRGLKENHFLLILFPNKYIFKKDLNAIYKVCYTLGAFYQVHVSSAPSHRNIQLWLWKYLTYFIPFDFVTPFHKISQIL